MSVDVNDLIPSLKSRLNPPGVELFADAVDADWVVRLTDAFWDGRLNGMTVLAGFEENAAARGGPAGFTAGIITPVDAVDGYDDPDGWSDDDLPREHQQLIVLLAAFRATLARLSNIETARRNKAGPVSHEVERSATLLKAILDTLRAELDEIKDNLSSYGTSDVVVLDALVYREWAMYDELTPWIR